MESAATEPNYGVSEVSGQYGPGVVIAWLLGVFCVAIQLHFEATEPTSPSQSRSEEQSRSQERPQKPGDKRGWGDVKLKDVDFNLLGIFSYPFVGTLDLLRNLKIYTADPEKIALFYSPYLILREAILIFGVLITQQFLSQPRRESRKTRPFYLYVAALGYLVLVQQIVGHYGMDSPKIRYAAIFYPLPPFVELSTTATSSGGISEFTSHYNTFSLWINTCRNSWASWRPLGLATVHESIMGRIFVLGCAIVGAIFTAADPKGHTDSRGMIVLAFIFGLVFFSFIFHWTLMLLVVSPVCVLVDLICYDCSLVPRSSAALLDLDQMATFICGGLLPLLWTVGSITLERWGELSLWSLWQFTKHLLKSLSGWDIVRKFIQIFAKVFKRKAKPRRVESGFNDFISSRT